MLFYEPQRGVCFPERVINCQSLQRRDFCLWQSLRRGKISSFSELIISVCETRVGQGVARIFLHRLFEVLGGFLEIGLRPLVPVEEALEVELIGFCIFGGSLRKPLFLFAHKPRTQSPVDVRSNL